MDLSRGIITGCDKHVEMFLPWWFDHLQTHNDLPVTIIDYGLSDWGRSVANTIGTLIPKKSISIPKCKHKPSDAYPEYRHSARESYLYKPFALQQSPFDQTIWLDVDCKVQNRLNTLFETPNFGIALSDAIGQDLAQKHKVFKSFETRALNGGVIVYQAGCSVIQAWVNATLSKGKDYIVDDVLLAELIYDEKLPVTYLPESYNTYWAHKKSDTIISHYSTPFGKKAIIEEMMGKVCGAKNAE